MEMKLTYITIHTMEPEIMKDFYVKYLGAVVDDARPFDRDGSGKDNRVASPSSYGTVYSLSFDGGVKIKLIPEQPGSLGVPSAVSPAVPSVVPSFPETRPPYAVRLTFRVGSRKRVNELTGQLITEGYDVIYEPGFYGMEHYSSSVFDPEGNVIELVA